jgi:transposase
MSDYRYRPEVEILSVTDTGRRRRWTDEEKLRIVEESFGGRVAETARRHDIGRTLLMRWRRQYREGMLVAASEGCPRFTPLAISGSEAPEGRDVPSVPGPATSREMAEITLVNGRRLCVAATIDPVVLVRLVQALEPS